MQAQLALARRLSNELTISHGTSSGGKTLLYVLNGWCHIFGITPAKAEKLLGSGEPAPSTAAAAAGPSADAAPVSKHYTRVYTYWKVRALYVCAHTPPVVCWHAHLAAMFMTFPVPFACLDV